MTDDEVRAIAALAEMTAPRPWRQSADRSGRWIEDAGWHYVAGGLAPEDRDFIIAASASVPDLCVEVLRLREALRSIVADRDDSGTAMMKARMRARAALGES